MQPAPVAVACKESPCKIATCHQRLTSPCFAYLAADDAGQLHPGSAFWLLSTSFLHMECKQIMDSPELITALATSDPFAALSRYTGAFDMFRVMGVSNKELVHSNILAALLNSQAAHGLGHRFRNAYVSSLADCDCIGAPLSAGVLTGISSAPAKVARELAHMDVLLDFPTLRLVIAIENKIWAADQPSQVARYQEALCELYPHYTHRMLVYLTPTGRCSPTVNAKSDVPVYQQSYAQLVSLIRQEQPHASPSAAHFMGELATHMEKTMTGNSELRQLCWKIFEQHETAYRELLKNFEYCIIRKLDGVFDGLERSLPFDPLFEQWNGQVEIKQYRNAKENWYDLDFRLKHWPAGVWVKIFKHHMFGVFPYYRGADMEALKAYLPAFTLAPKVVEKWKDHYAASLGFHSIEARRVLGKGDEVNQTHVAQALVVARNCVAEIEKVLAGATDPVPTEENMEPSVPA